MTKTVLALQSLLPAEMDMLDEHFNVIRLWKETRPEQVIQDNASHIHAIISQFMPVRRNLMEMLPNLEIISNFAVGYDNIDVAAAKERGIAVTNTPDVLTNDTADVAILLMMNVMRRAVEGDAFVRAGMWQKGPLQLSTSLAGKTLGIVGLGRIGQAIARRGAAFEMNVVYHGPSEKKDQPYQYYKDLMKMAQDCDVLVLSCKGGEVTQDLINYKILKALGPKGFLINIARASVVVEEDLLIALRNRDIAGAGLDVYWSEPNVPKEMLTMDHVVLTPHIGSATLETRTKMGQIVVENLLAHFGGKKLLTAV